MQLGETCVGVSVSNLTALFWWELRFPGETLVGKAIKNRLQGSMNIFRKHYHQPRGFLKICRMETKSSPCRKSLVTGILYMGVKHSVNELNEWTWPDFVSYIDFVSSPQRCFSCWRHYYPSDAYIMQSEVESAFCPEVLAAVRWSELYDNVPVRLVPSTVRSGAHWRHVNHVRPH